MPRRDRSDSTEYYILDPSHTDPGRLKRERERARELRKSRWWQDQLKKGICHYCERAFPARELTMDHVVPLARGGASTQGNIVPSCRECNHDKKLETPAERLLRELEEERKRAGSETGPGDDFDEQ
jgi:5-methylcytosine-specific restriction enzyme A